MIFLPEKFKTFDMTMPWVLRFLIMPFIPFLRIRDGGIWVGTFFGGVQLLFE